MVHIRMTPSLTCQRCPGFRRPALFDLNLGPSTTRMLLLRLPVRALCPMYRMALRTLLSRPLDLAHIPRIQIGRPATPKLRRHHLCTTPRLMEEQQMLHLYLKL